MVQNRSEVNKKKKEERIDKSATVKKDDTIRNFAVKTIAIDAFSSTFIMYEIAMPGFFKAKSITSSGNSSSSRSTTQKDESCLINLKLPPAP